MINSERLDYLLSLYHQLEPEKMIDGNTTMKGTSLARLAEVGGAPYNRVKTWLESTLKKRNEAASVVLLNEDMKNAKEQFRNCFALMQSRNKKYGTSWKRLRPNSIVDLMIMKLDRCQKQQLDNKAIEVEIEDVVNYGIFCLMYLRKPKE